MRFNLLQDLHDRMIVASLDKTLAEYNQALRDFRIECGVSPVPSYYFFGIEDGDDGPHLNYHYVIKDGSVCDGWFGGKFVPLKDMKETDPKMREYIVNRKKTIVKRKETINSLWGYCGTEIMYDWRKPREDRKDFFI